MIFSTKIDRYCLIALILVIAAFLFLRLYDFLLEIEIKLIISSNWCEAFQFIWWVWFSAFFNNKFVPLVFVLVFIPETIVIRNFAHQLQLHFKVNNKKIADKYFSFLRKKSAHRKWIQFMSEISSYHFKWITNHSPD